MRLSSIITYLCWWYFIIIITIYRNMWTYFTFIIYYWAYIMYLLFFSKRRLTWFRNYCMHAGMQYVKGRKNNLGFFFLKNGGHWMFLMYILVHRILQQFCVISPSAISIAINWLYFFFSTYRRNLRIDSR